MTRRSIRARTLTAAAGLLAASGLTLGGCASSARSDFYSARSIVLRGQPGDGSRVASAYPAPPAVRTARASDRR